MSKARGLKDSRRRPGGVHPSRLRAGGLGVQNIRTWVGNTKCKELGSDSHMRVSIPGLPKAILSAKSSALDITPAEAIIRLAEFLGSGNVTVLTGAGVSVDSGIRAYRGNDGRYMNPNYK